MALTRMPNWANSRAAGMTSADDAAFRCRVRGLADLALVGRDRSGADDDAALAVLQRLKVLHRGAGEPHRVERADQIDGDDALEIGERHRPVAADDAFGRADAGAVDQDARRAVVGGGLGERGFGCGGAGDVAGDGDAVDVDRHLGGSFLVDVENRHLGAGFGQHARGRGAEPRGSSGHDRGVSSNVHGRLVGASGRR